MTLRQGDICWLDVDDHRRPVLVVTRSAAIPVLGALVVAPVTRSIRGIPTEVPLGPEEGLPAPSVATFDNLRRARPEALSRPVGSLANPREQICRALAALADC